MKTWTVALLSALIPALVQSNDETPRWVITLADDSKIVFQPLTDQLQIFSHEFSGIVPVSIESIQSAEMDEDGVWRLKLANDEVVTGKLNQSITGQTAKGPVLVTPGQLRRIALAKDQALATPAAAKVTDFEWDFWRTGWEVVEGKRLASVRAVRPGFAYGHWANGRGGMALTGNGDHSWTDYEVAFDFKMLPANREFFHAHIPGESRGMIVFFRAKDLSESWNQPDTSYGFALNPDGTWTLLAYDGWHMPGNGWNSANQVGVLEKLATGKAELTADASEGRLQLQVNGARLQGLLNDELLFDHTHDSGEIEPILYGGFGVMWCYESMGWVENLSLRHLNTQD
ncbi:MAG: hypothetical protein AAF585_16440 [Verrucomicrobiota bacterium]